MKKIITRSLQLLTAITLGLVLSATGVGVASATGIFAEDKIFPPSDKVIAENIQSAATVNIGAIMRPKEGKADELRNSLLSLVKPTREEAGSLIYNVYEAKDGTFLLYEVWRSQEDLEKHFQKPYLKDFVSKADSLLEGKNDAHFGKLISPSTDSNGHAQHIQNTATTSTVNIISIKRPKSGKADELRNSLLSLVKPTREEAGSITYNIYEEKDGSLFLYEVWRSQEDLEKHFQKSYIKDFRSKANSLADRNEVYFGKLISVPTELQ